MKTYKVAGFGVFFAALICVAAFEQLLAWLNIVPLTPFNWADAVCILFLMGVTLRVECVGD